jgi:flagellar motor switch protein FliN/FliY
VTETATEEKLDEAQAVTTDASTEEAGEQGGTAAAVLETAEAVEEEPLEEGQTRNMALSEGEPGRAADRIGFLNNIELEAAVELGRAMLSIGEVLGLGPGSLVQLDKMLGEPVELMIKDRLIARGEVVILDDRFGLRITEIVSRNSQ